MSNGFKWELSQWGDGTTRLAYWDSLTGKDTVIVLNNDGTASLSSYQDESDFEQLEPINLSEFLIRWINNG